jgi:hypothetical protein
MPGPQWADAFAKARDAYRTSLKTVTRAIEKARQAQEQRFESLVAEGRRVEPKVAKAFDELKTKLQPKPIRLDFAALKVDPKQFEPKAIRARLDEGMTRSLHRIGLPTRKEVQALARKVDKLAAAQA